MSYFISAILGLFLGFVVGIIYMMDIDNYITAIKLSNIMNASMLDCVTHKVITEKQVHDIETIFHKHIELNFKHIKTNHNSYKFWFSLKI